MGVFTSYQQIRFPWKDQDPKRGVHSCQCSTRSLQSLSGCPYILPDQITLAFQTQSYRRRGHHHHHHRDTLCSVLLNMAGTSQFVQASNPRRRKCRKTGFRRRCSYVYKQQRARFYIIGRCVSMLLCWHDHEPSDWIIRWESIWLVQLAGGTCPSGFRNQFAYFHLFNQRVAWVPSIDAVYWHRRIGRRRSFVERERGREREARRILSKSRWIFVLSDRRAEDGKLKLIGFSIHVLQGRNPMVNTELGNIVNSD